MNKSFSSTCLIRMDRDTHDRLREHAWEQRTNVSELIRGMIDAYFEVLDRLDREEAATAAPPGP
jgi:BMFP domain-containing protein YqiC